MSGKFLLKLFSWLINVCLLRLLQLALETGLSIGVHCNSQSTFEGGHSATLCLNTCHCTDDDFISVYTPLVTLLSSLPLSLAGDESCSEKQTLDLSKQQLKKVPKQDDAQNIRKLILDENELQKIDNIDSYLKIETVTI